MLNKRTKKFIFIVPFVLAGLLSYSAAAQSKTSSDWVDLTPSQIAKLLGWRSTPEANSICKGYYQELPITLKLGNTDDETDLKADRVILGQKKPDYFNGNVVITQTGTQIRGDRAIRYPDPKTNKTTRIDIYGNVHLREPGMLAVGSEAHLNLLNKTSSLKNATFRYQITPLARENVYNSKHQLRTINIKGLNYRGSAKKIQQTKPKHIILHHATLTSCTPFSNFWTLSSTTTKLNQTSGEGIAYNTVLWLHGIPIFYSPIFSFPISNRRKSGFLMPGLGFSSLSGTTISTPYYWNMAPNYDMTITPNFISKRGTKVDSLFRYLDTLGTGEIYYSLIPHDAQFAQLKDSIINGGAYPTRTPGQLDNLKHSSDSRYEFAWNDSSQYNPYWISNVNIDYVSDDYYFTDFEHSPLSPNTLLNNALPTTQLTQSMSLSYAQQHWSVDAELENFQTLKPVTLAVPGIDQYARLPDLNINGIYPDSFLGLDYSFGSQMTYFAKPLIEHHFKSILTVTGGRYNFDPALSLYKGKAWGYLNPKLTFEGTLYNLHDPIVNPSYPSFSQKENMQRALPIYDIDSGLYFDRSTHFGSTQYTQTLEPRLFYLYAPYVNQEAFPVFDTSLPTLSYNQLFNTNRFQGNDRIGDANQMSLGITSRFIQNATGIDVLDMSIGQIYYFENRRVHLPESQPSPLLDVDTTNISPVVAQLTWQIASGLSLTGNLAYDSIHRWFQSSNATLTYSHDQKHFLTASYVFSKWGGFSVNNPEKNLKIANFGFVWPLTTQWQTIGGINYDLAHQQSQTYLYGVEYDSCCWQVRLINSRNYIGVNSDNSSKYDSQISLQFVLTGLGAVGNTSPTSLLQTTIPGYTDTFGLNPLLTPS